MDMHPLIGESILRPDSLLHPLLPGVRSHHEHWDGTGYPDHLKGEEIPIEARIMAVAGAFHAVNSPPPRRKSLQPELALTEPEKKRGIRFEPAIVAGFDQLYLPVA